MGKFLVGHSVSKEVREKIAKQIRWRWRTQRAKMLEANHKAGVKQRGIFPKQLKQHRKDHPEFYANLPKRPSTRKKIAESIKKLWTNHAWRNNQMKKRKKLRTKRTMSQGYSLLRCENHPYADHRGRVEEHRLVVEKYIHRYLRPTEIVHHRDGNRLNNHISNLELMTRATHIAHHNSERKLLIPSDISLIKDLRRDKSNSIKVLAKKFGVSTTTIVRAIMGHH